ncbi:GTP cyclohydrolase FolE2 [Motiliproteus sp.]|uniref:GTP cyclohydrolase FolE2 n=1 Tax=Motiliproteus sp. TaxID=1898955 RepID=UPI003BAB3B2F
MLNPKPLPDVASQHSASHSLTLQWVGMEQIALPIRLDLADGRSLNLSAKADLYVSLDRPDVKGIHMSRLYLEMNRFLANQSLTHESLTQLLALMVESQQGISRNARITLSFDLLLQRDSLRSQQQGYQSYPAVINAERIDDQLKLELELTIPYSSTCPCSASLSRQLYSEAVDRQFSGDAIDKQALLQWIQSEAGSIATPHSQRSYAYLQLQLADGAFPDLSTLIDRIEEALGTPVQTAVKRSDEQDFARLNAENLMFCEDAARRVKTCLENQAQISDYWFKVEHQESLHAHNAVVIDQKFTTEN